MNLSSMPCTTFGRGNRNQMQRGNHNGNRPSEHEANNNNLNLTCVSSGSNMSNYSPMLVNPTYGQHVESSSP